MPLSQDEQQAVMARIAADDVVIARQALRDAFWHLTRWPFSRARVDAFFDAFERLQDLNANRAIGNMAPLIVPLDRRLTALELRVDLLEQRDRLSSEP